MTRSTSVKHKRAYAQFCAYLKNLRSNYGYTQAEVAQTLNISRAQYSALESGRSMLTFDHLCSLADHYKLELFELMLERY